MKRFSLALCTLLTLIVAPAASRAQTSRPAPEVRSFELTGTPPPTPALRYELLYDILADRRPGNAAILYLDSVLLLPPDARENGEKALNAYDAKDFKTFASLADAIDKPGLFQELDLAARREQCDWEPPFHEMGVET